MNTIYVHSLLSYIFKFLTELNSSTFFYQALPRLQASITLIQPTVSARTDKTLSAGFSEASVEEELRHFEFPTTRLSVRLTRAKKSRKLKDPRLKHSRSRTLPSADTRATDGPHHGSFKEANDKARTGLRPGKRRGFPWDIYVDDRNKSATTVARTSLPYLSLSMTPEISRLSRLEDVPFVDQTISFVTPLRR
jgi:hypothetical protein